MKNKVDKTVNMLKADPELTAATLTRVLHVTRPYAYNLLSLARKRIREEIKFVPIQPAPVQPAPVQPAPDMVNHPAHYKVGGLETIDFIEAKNLNYRLGNVVKYITRADHKGDRLENLKKAKWYLEREIAVSS